MSPYQRDPLLHSCSALCVHNWDKTRGRQTGRAEQGQPAPLLSSHCAVPHHLSKFTPLPLGRCRLPPSALGVHSFSEPPTHRQVPSSLGQLGQGGNFSKGAFQKANRGEAEIRKQRFLFTTEPKSSHSSGAG